MRPSIELIAQGVIAAVRGFVSREAGILAKTFNERMDAWESRLNALPAGPRGEPGERGPPGESIRGEAGSVGPVGHIGPPGEPGPAGEPGAHGEVGPQGAIGLRGETGAQGERGETGVRGLEGPQGARGERGETGTEGEIGVRGERGAKGEQGPAGEIGTPGARGETGEIGAQGERGPAGEPGPQGDAGERGEDGAPGAMGLRGVAGPEGARGEAGARGENGEPGAVGPAGERGQDGPMGERGAPGANGIAGLRGEVGTAGQRGEKGDSGPPGKDGSSPHPDTVALLVRDAVDKAVAALPPAKDGAPGRDAAELVVIPGVYMERSYPAGTYAKHAGGEIRATRNTDPLNASPSLEAAGWTVSREGVAGVEIEQGEDPREITVVARLTSGTKAASKFIVPMVLDKGVWREGEYQHGDHVSWDGSGWIAQRKTSAKPGDEFDKVDKDWRLATKRGRDGRDGKDGGSSPPPKPVVRVR